MTTLNKRIKEDIVENAVIKAGIYKRKEKLIKRRAKWVEQVRLKALGGKDNEKRIKLLEKRFNKAIENAPKNIKEIIEFNVTQDNDIFLNIAGCRFHAYFNGEENYTTQHEQIYKITPNDFVIKPGDKLEKEFHAIEAEQESIHEEKREIQQKVNSALIGYRTLEKLVKSWPEVKKILPEDLSSLVTTNLPAIQTEDLNNLIGLKGGK